MSLRKLTPFIIFILLIDRLLYAQSPSYFNYTIENGAPSNEIYSIIQDKEGYIWIGCDAGVFRFNGVQYEQYTSSHLSARSATGLIQSTSGRIYGYNFNRQIFYIEKGKLKVLKDWDKPVNSITNDLEGKMWITSSDGVFMINENDLKIKPIRSDKHIGDRTKYFAGSGVNDENGNIYYHNSTNVFKWKIGQCVIFSLNDLTHETPICISRSRLSPWVVKMTGETVYRPNRGQYEIYRNAGLTNALKGRKVNCLFGTDDGKLWFCTYTGLVCHDSRLGTTEVMFEQFSFSNGFLDKEGNYWFSTLHNGIIRVPQIKIRTWSTVGENGNPDQYSHIVIGKDRIYACGTSGFITELDAASYGLKKYSHNPSSDIGSIFYDPIRGALVLNKMNNLYVFKGGHFDLLNNGARPIKCFLRVKDGYFALSSQGLCFVKDLGDEMVEECIIDREWYRDICRSPFSEDHYAATNNGLAIIERKNGGYSVRKRLLVGQQIISVTSQPRTGTTFLLTFDGKVFCFNKLLKVELLKQLGNDIRASQIRNHEDKLYLATNKGILLIDPENGKEVMVDRYSGLSSNNIRYMTFDDHFCWAVGDGIQRIPKEIFNIREPRGRVVERGILINGVFRKSVPELELDYDDKLSLLVDGLCYRSNGNFQFAYRIKGYHDSWIKVPGSVDRIDLAALPTGQITIEVKLIDHSGMDSANVLSYSFFVQPPFWQRWWFYVLIAALVGFTAYLIFRKRESNLKKQQQQELRRLKLENELRLTQQNALKAQMNPHFLFNVLNSIKGFIYENDKKNAAKYLSDFSNLVRKVLEMSSLPKVTLAQEIEVLTLYIDLEAMLLESDFSYTMQVDETIDTSYVHIPALLIQPYVENAFKHGLRHKTGTKKLDIHFEYIEKEEVLIVRITDNGIGRSASAGINSQNDPGHHSFATSAMEKRLQLLNHEKENMIGVEIVDNFEGEEPSGTTVILKVHA